MNQLLILFALIGIVAAYPSVNKRSLGLERRTEGQFKVGILKRHLNTDQEQQTQQQQQPAVGQQQLQQQTHEQPTHDTRQLRSVDEPQNNDGELQHTELRDGTEWYEDEPWVVYFDHVMGKLGPDANTSDYYDECNKIVDCKGKTDCEGKAVFTNVEEEVEEVLNHANKSYNKDSDNFWSWGRYFQEMATVEVLYDKLKERALANSDNWYPACQPTFKVMDQEMTVMQNAVYHVKMFSMPQYRHMFIRRIT